MIINKGNIISIGEDKYDVLSTLEEVDWYDTEKNKFVGEHTAAELHKLGDSALHPTHLLKLYHDGKIILLRIEQDKPPKELKRVRQRCHMLSYHDKKELSKEDIKVEQ